jgi:hypothetical protein
MSRLASVLAGCGGIARVTHLGRTSSVVDILFRKIIYRTPRDDILLIGRQTAYIRLTDLLPLLHASTSSTCKKSPPRH